MESVDTWEKGRRWRPVGPADSLRAIRVAPSDDAEVLRCTNCGLEIAWGFVVVEGRPYCCGGCAQGGPCYCSYDPLEREPDAVVAAPASAAARGHALEESQG